MASTNKTEYLKLSQYLNSDRPSYLQDYNEDMRKIDFAIKNSVAETNWKDLTVNENSYTAGSYDKIKIKRVGKIVYCSGHVTARRKDSATDYNLIEIPEGYRPYVNARDDFLSFYEVLVQNITSSIYIGRLRYVYRSSFKGLAIQGIEATPQMGFYFNVSWITDDGFPLIDAVKE